MIFAAYAGTGKSVSAEKMDRVLDMAIVPYKYSFPQDYKKRDFLESDKGCVEYPLDEEYPEKYVADILQKREKYVHIVISSDNRVMDILDVKNVEYMLCYPDRCLKEEYRRRYQERGNGEEFMKIFVDRWDKWTNSFEQRQCKKYVVHQGEFLLDIIKKYAADERDGIV